MLKRSLESLAALDHPNYEVLVVDNTPGDPETARVVSKAGARYVLEPRTGLSRARNAGALAAGGELIGFIDDDAIAEPTWLRRHSDILADPSLMASTGRIVPNSPDSAFGPDPARLLDLGDEPLRVDRETPGWFERANFGGLGFGGNMVFKRSLFHAGLRFRKSLGLGSTLGVAEESYAFFTIIREGHAVAYVPDAVVRHDRPPLATDRKTQETLYRRGIAAYLFLLLVEESGFRRRTGRYILGTALRSPQPWRRGNPQSPEANRLRLLAAAMGGPLLYARSRLGRG